MIAFCLLLIKNYVFLGITYHLQVCLSKIYIGNYFEPNIVTYWKIVAHLNVSTRKWNEQLAKTK